MKLKAHRNLTTATLAFALTALFCAPSLPGCKKHPPPASAREVVPVAAPAAAPPAPCPEGRECVLERWMDGVLSHLDVSTPAPFARAFRDLAAAQPEGYPEWRALAENGAVAAERADAAAVKRACNACHDQYRPKYRAEERRKPVNLPIDYSRVGSGTDE